MQELMTELNHCTLANDCADIFQFHDKGGGTKLVKPRHQRGAGRTSHDQGLLTHRVLGRHAGGAMPGAAGLRLDAAQRKHEAACAVAPIGPKAMARAMSNALMTLPEAPKAMRSRRPTPTKVLCTKPKPCNGVPTWSANSRGAAQAN